MNTNFILRRKICLRILLCAGIIFAGTVTHTASAQTYDPYAVQVINNLIANNGLQATPDAPETWGFFSWWSDSTPKQLLGLGIVNKGLTGAVVLSGLRNMIGLNIYDNSITKLDVSGCSQLQWLWCWRNNITDIDLKDCVALEDFQCSENYLEKLDVSNCVNLKLLICPSNKLTDLDLTNNTQLEGIGIANNNFTKFNAPNCIKLRALTFKNNKLTELDVTRHKQLRVLTGEKNSLTELNITGLGYFNTFELYNQNVSIELKENETMEYTHSIPLNNPSFENSAISYSDGILKSSDNTVDKTNFTVQTIGNNNYQLSGTMHFTYTITDIKSPENINLKIYPNPTTGELKISPLPLRDFPQRGKKTDFVNGELKIKSIELFDINGRKAPLSPFGGSPEGGKQFPSFGGAGVVLNMSHLPTGIYLLHIDTEQGEIIKKIIKQ